MSGKHPHEAQLGAVKPTSEWKKERARKTVCRLAVDAGAGVDDAWLLLAMLDLLPPGARQPAAVLEGRHRCASCDKPTVSSRHLQPPEGTVAYAGHGMCRPCLQKHRRKEAMR